MKLETANMTVYHLTKPIFSEKEMFSKSNNTPFHATEFLGKVIEHQSTTIS